MPIRPHHSALYPDDWPELSASIRFYRAAGRCESCGRPHGRQVLHAGDGRWFDRQRGTWRDVGGAEIPRPTKLYRLRWTFVRLGTYHLDHASTNSDPTNLRASCQRCHLLNDRDEHRRRRAVTVRAKRALADLFERPYWQT